MASQVKVTLRRSTNGKPKSLRRTVQALGLRKIGQTVVRKNSDAVQGQIAKVKHLVDVEEID